jgi:hypothetical protein
MALRRAIAVAIAAAGLVGTGLAAADSSPVGQIALLRPSVEGVLSDSTEAREWTPALAKGGRGGASRVRDDVLPKLRAAGIAKETGAKYRASGSVADEPKAPAPSPAFTFEGISSNDHADAGSVPDPNGDVGPNHYVQMVNRLYAVFDKKGKLLGGPFPENRFWEEAPLVPDSDPCKSADRGDPIVLYDELAGRWLLTFFAFNRVNNVRTAPFYECIAVSKTSDPLGAWWFYSFNLSSHPAIGTSFPDYPKFGVWPDAYYMSANLFPEAGGTDALFIAFEREKLLAGQAVRYFAFVDTSLGGRHLPADVDGDAPPAGSPGYFLVPDPSKYELRLYRLAANWTTATANLDYVSIPVDPYDWMVCDPRDIPTGLDSQCVDQPGTAIRLDPMDLDQMMFRLVYRNRAAGLFQSLLAVQTIDVANDATQRVGRAGLRWYEIRSPNVSTPSLYQQGTFAPDASVHRWNPAIAMDRFGSIAIGFNVSNASTVFPGIRYAARKETDPAGQLPLTETTLIAGTGSKQAINSDGLGRWGDYSSMSVDPVDGCTFWYTGQYLPRNVGAADWNTRIGVFSIPPCVAPQPPVPDQPQPPPQDTTPPSDPVLSSPSHRVGVGSTTRVLQIRWSGAADDRSGVDGFSYTLDTQPASLPDTAKDAEEDTVGVDTVPLPPGTYYFHLRTGDNAGNWTSTQHIGPFVIVATRGGGGTPVRCRVPNVRGKTVKQARSSLRARQCTLGRVTRSFSARVKAGRIIRQSRKPGLRLPRRAKVNVVVSRGRRR